MRNFDAQREGENRILQPGRNCWRIARARRASFLIDSSAYFPALRAAATRAQRSIFIIGWDIDSRTKLAQDGVSDGFPIQLGDFLKALIEDRRGLDVYILNWDFAMLYAPGREVLPIYTLGWQRHRHLHFYLDGRHPVGASHHQKIVVIDDAVAFVGGMDLAQERWDTPDHEPNAPYRRRSNGQAYAPVHDVQMMVDGEAAAALGMLARERWRNATGNQLRADSDAGTDPWPPSIVPDISDVDVAIVRTVPRFNGGVEILELRELYVDAIRSAKNTIYIENQYLTASSVGALLELRLREPNPPEIVVVSRLTGGGWLEQTTMEVLRARLLRRLRAADRHGKFRIYYPDCDGLNDQCINVHSKLMVVDDRLALVGSANLNNRSMGLDTECNLAIEATEPNTAKAITGLRNRLLAEHLGVGTDRMELAIRQAGSLIVAIESLRGNPHTLRHLEGEVSPEADALLPQASVVDPEAPIDPDRLIDELIPVEHRPSARKRITATLSLLAAIGALAAAWRWGPLHEWLDKETLINVGRTLQRTPATPVWVIGAYILAAITAIPITLVIFTTAVVFGPITGFVYAILGSLVGASLTFALGHVFGRDIVRRLGGARLNTLSRWLRHRGLLAMLTVRLIPVAPFTVVNLVAGASHIRFRDFLLGTIFGMVPGAMAITVFSDRLAAAVHHPSPINIALLVAAAAIIGAAAFATHRWLRRREAENTACAGGSIG
ncbi:VTT domain-containing protein [Methylocaldum sp. RMAD-M]|jgi:phospholipase D1/2|uniref:VTT domain-containing protein n=1 Tax=Methylocaldum sp. RMAD-M TaxID=2806557 RepID=UPI000989EC51|nr:VTT domain-containing protein [Methylocaldum sp. RMAD-M]